MIVQTMDPYEFRGKSEISKNGKTFAFYRFEDRSGKPYEIIGFDVQNVESLERGQEYFLLLRIGTKGNASLIGVNH